MFHDKSLQSVGIECAIRTIEDYCVRLRGIIRVFLFFFVATLVDCQIKIKAHKKVTKHAQLKSALSKCTYRFNKPNRLMTIIISRVINLFSIFVFDIGFHVITFWVNFHDVIDASLTLIPDW